jgi:hypothetical protein
MHENLIQDRFQLILESITLIKERTAKVAKAKDLVRPEDVAMLVDSMVKSVTMRLQVLEIILPLRSYDR